MILLRRCKLWQLSVCGTTAVTNVSAKCQHSSGQHVSKVLLGRKRTMDRVAEPAPALASTTSVPAFWILSVILAASSSLNSTLGVACIIKACSHSANILPSHALSTGTEPLAQHAQSSVICCRGPCNFACLSCILTSASLPMCIFDDIVP